MFETATLSSGPTPKRFWSTCLGVVGEVFLLGCALLAPILSPQILPKAVFATIVAAPGPPPPPPPKGPGVQIQPHGPRRTATGLYGPTVIPLHAATIIESAPDVSPLGTLIGVPGGTEGGVDGGLVQSIVTGATPVTPPPQPRVVERLPTPAPAPAAPIRIRVSGVQMAQPIFRPEPVYPPIARQMRVAGTVELTGVIGTDGHIKELRVMSGHPLLAKAALDAVSQWVYRPTMLNGDPVEVIAPITVTFRLNP